MTRQEASPYRAATEPGPANDAPEAPFGHPKEAFDDVLRFGEFLLIPRRRALFHNDTPVELGSRAFDLLTVLVKFRGRVVTKEEIMRFVWPSTIVDDCNLRFQMGVLRRALQEHRDIIKTIPGRGYQLIADDESDRSVPGGSAEPEQNLGEAERRTADLRLLQQRRFPGGEDVAILVVRGTSDLPQLVDELFQFLQRRRSLVGG